jgi:hypothetical protein
MKMSDKLWKKTERAIMKLLGGTRIPITGRIRGSAPDGEHSWLSIEIKHRKVLPAWLQDAMNQAELSNVGGKLPVVVLHESGQHHRNNFVVLRLGDFIDWFGDSMEKFPANESLSK